MDQYEDQIHASEQIQALVNTYLTAYRNGTITRDQAMTGIKGVLGTINSELTAGQNIQNILTYLSTQNNTGATTNDILTDTQNKMMETANQIMQSLDVYEQNSNTITGYMSSFGELTEHISDIRDTIYDVEDELDDNFDDLKDTLEDGFDDMVDALGEYRSRKMTMMMNAQTRVEKAIVQTKNLFTLVAAEEEVTLTGMIVIRVMGQE